MLRIALLLALAGCARRASTSAAKIIKDACLASVCSSSSECRDIVSGCRYCWGGHCSSVLPADPRDAGTDAAPGGTTP